ncbi:carbohydrate kinase [Hymenobacter amundsenii]|uniref:Carbohydrate kinase n=1 Tax=Hymenobacter amundsenii TaxID=2006685 RepID=A0A246FHB3_9BACT|nr:PfkB family carbohydrate kinase [Hymenobacter amundsenii]OWP61901.1 carbohydrate kinase [Hymenobacter amundsenii]
MTPATIVCIGEMFWDLLPEGRRAGGAPLHAALQLQRLGQSVQLISRVGDDELGRELLAYSAHAGLGTQLIQRSRSHLTGVGKTSVRGHQHIYRLVEPVAWDYLQYTPEVQAAVGQARAVVYSSLTARSAASRETLYRLLPQSRYKVFDVNLRAPHYRHEVVKYLLRQADLVRLTRAELTEIMGWLGQPATPATALPWLAGHFGPQVICLTDSAAGATLWAANQLLHATGPALTAPPESGGADSFLATLLTGLLQGLPPADYLRQACAAAPPPGPGSPPQ